MAHAKGQRKKNPLWHCYCLIWWVIPVRKVDEITCDKETKRTLKESKMETKTLNWHMHHPLTICGWMKCKISHKLKRMTTLHISFEIQLKHTIEKLCETQTLQILEFVTLTTDGQLCHFNFVWGRQDFQTVEYSHFCIILFQHWAAHCCRDGKVNKLIWQIDEELYFECCFDVEIGDYRKFKSAERNAIVLFCITSCVCVWANVNFSLGEIHPLIKYHTHSVQCVCVLCSATRYIGGGEAVNLFFYHYKK